VQRRGRPHRRRRKPDLIVLDITMPVMDGVTMLTKLREHPEIKGLPVIMLIGELCNMTVGNFKSNLCDAGLTCKLSPPRIERTEDFQLNIVEGGTSQRYGFHSKEARLYADLSVNPFSET
jgi:DNA-binding NtrC family response regulator